MAYTSMTTAPDISLQITSINASSERRITPSWSISKLKSKLEPITGIPPSAQRLHLRSGPNPKQHDGRGSATVSGGTSSSVQSGSHDHDSSAVVIEVGPGEDEENVTLDARWRLVKGMEIYVEDTRPPSLQQNLIDTSSVPKYSLPTDIYEQRSDSVLAWKRREKLGRFDPAAPEKVNRILEGYEREVKNRGIEVGRRVRVGGEDTKRGIIRYIGPVDTIPGSIEGSIWVGIELDEPVGKNDGSVNGKRYFHIGGGDVEEGNDKPASSTNTDKEETGDDNNDNGNQKKGIFVRPDRVEVGDFEVLNDIMEDLEEI
ncbi:MAG: hypothetical protein M1823_004449 [Watsoniomyces obsoletus]|nr:MAG: hypothetical protein M1823_004449 [Watsoniomyces obsoletus]